MSLFVVIKLTYIIFFQFFQANHALKHPKYYHTHPKTQVYVISFVFYCIFEIIYNIFQKLMQLGMKSL